MIHNAITIYPRLFGTRLIGTRPTETRLIGTLKIDRVQLERVSLARNLIIVCIISEWDYIRYSTLICFRPTDYLGDTLKILMIQLEQDGHACIIKYMIMQHKMSHFLHVNKYLAVGCHQSV